MNYVNLTPHIIRVRFAEDNAASPLESDLIIQPTGKSARIDQHDTEMPDLDDGIPQTEVEYGDILELPAPNPGTIYVVSMPTAIQAAALGRNEDIRFPDTNKRVIRNEAGHPYATRRLLKAKIAK